MTEFDIWYSYQSVISSPDRLALFISDNSAVIQTSSTRQQPKIGVLVPARNEEKLIARALAGINNAASTFRKPVFVLVIDNGSDDDTAKIACRFGVSVITEGQTGLANVYNTGLAAMPDSVDTVLVTDADSVVGQNWISDHTKALSDHNIMFTFGRARFLGDAPVDTVGHYGLMVYDGLVELSHKVKNKLGIRIAHGCNVAFRLDPIKTIGGYNREVSSVAASADLCARAEKLGGVRRLPDTTVLTSARRVLEPGISTSVQRQFRTNCGFLFYRITGIPAPIRHIDEIR